MSKKKDSLPLVDLEKVIKRARKSLHETSEEKAQELLNKRVVEKTGKKCHCGGHIVKVKSWEPPYVRFNGIYGPGSRGGPRNPVEVFTPLHCEDCGIQYFKLPKTT